MRWRGSRRGSLTWRYRIRGKTYEVAATVETSATTRTSQVLQTRRGCSSPGSAIGPSASKAVAMPLRQAQAPGSGASG